jgi:two-component system, cell cycle response regulator
MARILVIEDHALNLELMVYLLQAAGHEALCATDGEAGLAMALRERPDLVLCDIQMPGTDGHAVANALRAHPLLASLPLVAVTAAAMAGDRDRALAAGFDVLIAKPIDPPVFLSMIEPHLPAGPRSPPSGPAPAQRAMAPVPPELAAPRPGLSLLMVDDREPQLELKRDLLEPAGYAVHGCGDADSAWALLQRVPVDLVLSDVVMPGGGFSLLARVRADPRWRTLPFLFLTSTCRDEASRARGLALGADAYLVRPLDLHVVLQEIRRALLPADKGTV